MNRTRASSSGEVLVALDTSSGSGSLALAVDGMVLDSVTLPVEGRQAAFLIPAMDRMLAHHALTPTQVSGLVVGAGPGSFTGIRIGVATARGIGHALGVPVWTYGSLEAAYFAVVCSLASEPPRQGEVHPEKASMLRPWHHKPPPILVLFDARADRLYAGGWEAGELWHRPFLAPTALTLGELEQCTFPEGVQVCGSGTHRHKAALEACGFGLYPPPHGAASGVGLLSLHLALSPENRPVPLMPGMVWTPDYLRPSQPERLAREERAAAPPLNLDRRPPAPP